ncbi:TPA: adenylyltransferase/cytidyltransferase family protein [Candidatus Woesearchaeota archaeon]|nr:adenylyltransferase/cytidyltransferase family protein [Candidatus Woesearchaeota archaeon]|tara:strand:+ start:162 stop:626 length:465 start_codon:yes stop_codon:yes gene_type:complete
MKIAIASGYFNPLHVGHLDYMESARALADKLFVIVNNDYQVSLKGSTPFMVETDRLRIIDALKFVNGVFLSRDRGESVLGTLKRIIVMKQANSRNSFIFCNGGNRVSTNTLEERFCAKNPYYLTSVYNVGGEKRQSSSTLITKAALKDGDEGII